MNFIRAPGIILNLNLARSIGRYSHKNRNFIRVTWNTDPISGGFMFFDPETSYTDYYEKEDVDLYLELNKFIDNPSLHITKQ
jgi:hypothetical protein